MTINSTFSRFTNKVRQAFSDAALHYDLYASLQQEIGRELIQSVIDHQPCTNVLDVGTGTGRLARRAAYYFPDACIVGLDLAEGMLAVAKEKSGTSVEFIQADAQHLPFQNETFDLILSNFVYQWVEDLGHSLLDASRCLNQGGVLSATLFGRQTFKELFQSFDYCTNSDRVNYLPDLDLVQTSLRQAGLSSIAVRSELIVMEFPDVWDLLKWIKFIGANRLNETMILSPKKLEQISEYYMTHFSYHNGIKVSFEVITIKAAKN